MSGDCVATGRMAKCQKLESLVDDIASGVFAYLAVLQGLTKSTNVGSANGSDDIASRQSPGPARSER